MTETLSVILVDDEELARRRLASMLAREPNIQIVAECEGGAAAVRAIRELKPDLVFLDVQMPELDGFEVLDEIGVDAMPPVIFVTAFDDYAVNAFERGALDYLLKPVDHDRFAQTLRRVRARIGSPAPAIKEELSALLRLLSSAKGGERLGVRIGGKVLFLDASDIFWIQARDDIARIHLADSYHDVREPLSRLESRLPPGRFMRVHRSAIVNMSKIKEIEPFDQGDQMIILTNGRRVTSGRSYRKALQDFLKLST